MSGIVMTAIAAVDNEPHLVYRNAVGGIAVRTLAFVAADAVYRRATTSTPPRLWANLLFGCLLITLLAIALLATFTPPFTILGVHPASAVMVAFYAGGLWLIRSRREPRWQAGM